MLTCKQVYNPPAIRQNPGFLVVDGSLHVGHDSTVIKLSRTRNLDSLSPVPELLAQVAVIGSSAQTFLLSEQSDGRYVTDQLNLDYNEKYQLKINTADGREYLSDTFRAMQAPLIDSISWRQDSVGVSIYANVNDPQTDARYYKWDYVETWKYQTAYLSQFDFVNGQLVYKPPQEQSFFCWQNFASSDIVIATTSKLAANVVNQQLIAVVPTGSEKLSIRYSINVKQYALGQEAYLYWQNVKKNTEQLGTLFDAQPSQLTGNIHCTSNANEPVIGYIGASAVQQKRIFISNAQVINWNYQRYYNDCYYTPVLNISPDQAYRYLTGPHPLWVLLGSTNGFLDIVQLYCGDCREHGGSNKQPDFWQ